MGHLCALIFSFEVVTDSIQRESLYYASFLSPLLTGSVFVRRIMVKNGFVLAGLSSLGYFAAFLNDGWVHVKLFFVSLGFSSLFLLFALGLSSPSFVIRERSVFALMTGLVLHMVIKFSGFGQDAVFFSSHWTIGACCFTLAAKLVLFLDKYDSLCIIFYNFIVGIFTSQCQSSDEVEYSSVSLSEQGTIRAGPFVNGRESVSEQDAGIEEEEDEESTNNQVDRQDGSSYCTLFSEFYSVKDLLSGESRSSFLFCIRIGAGIGSLFFLAHLFYTSHGVIPRWVNMNPFPSGILIIFCLAFSTLAMKSSIMHSGCTWIVLVLGILLLLLCKNEVGLLGGCFATFSYSAFWFLLIANFPAGQNQRLVVWASALATYLLFFHFMACTVLIDRLALGIIFRGKPYLVLIFALISILFAMDRRKIFSFPIVRITFPPNPVILVVLLISLVGILPAAIARSKNYHYTATNHFVPLDPPVASLSSYGKEIQASTGTSWDEWKLFGMSREYGLQTFHLAAIEYDIQFGLNRSVVDFSVFLSLFQFPKPDVIGLLRSDTLRMWTGNRDVVEYLGHHLAYSTALYGVSPVSSTCGVSLLSTYQLVCYDAGWLESSASASSTSELTPILQASLTTVFNNSITLHFNVWITRFSSDDIQRKHQVREVVSQSKRLASVPFLLMAGTRVDQSDASISLLFSSFQDVVGAFTNGTYFPTVQDSLTAQDFIFFKWITSDFGTVVSESTFFSHLPIKAFFSHPGVAPS